ncbi:MAG: acyltransferase [Alphaproteobacteria bacterium]|nr:MAG: acyltransferase [Alphaproteobacteria bacterium]
MDRETSIFLDLCRFAAALVVFLGHTAGRSFTGGFLWPLAGYLDTAVVVFFVMSGFVIAYVADSREHTARDYAAARLSRLYSVLLPALLITAAADTIGLSVNPAFYHDGPWGYADQQPLRFFVTSLFANEFWGAELHAGSLSPVWSLSYEASFYLMFGLFAFLKGALRWGLLALTALVVGPAILALLPLWLLGYGIYVWNQRRGALPLPLAILLFVGGGALLVASPWVGGAVGTVEQPWVRVLIVREYIDAIAFASLLVGFYGLPARAKGLMLPLVRPARYLGSLTFALYLFHRPLIMMFAALGWQAPETWGQRLLVLGGTFAIVVLVGRPCEQAKVPLKRLILRLLPGGRAAAAKQSA